MTETQGMGIYNNNAIEQGLRIMVEQSLSARSVSVLPLLLMAFIHVIVTPLRDVFSIEPLLAIPYYLFGLLIGIYLYRKTTVVKDFEYRRSRVMKSMKKAYAAEESGVWQTNAEVSGSISDQSNLSKNVSQISSEAPELELSDEEKVDIDLLNESQKIVEATRRVTGQTNFDDEEIASTIGATRNVGPMDKLLDFVSGLFGKSAREKRDGRRLSALKAASDATPVKAEKPQVPIQFERNEVVLTPDSEVIHTEDVSSKEPKVSSQVYTEQSIGTNYSNFSANNIQTGSNQSIESMAMMPSTTLQTFTQPTPNAARCRGCSYVVKKEERFCENCGLDII